VILRERLARRGAGAGACWGLVDGNPTRPTCKRARRVLGAVLRHAAASPIKLNRYEQFTTAIDGLDVHFLHVRSPVQGATPCIMDPRLAWVGDRVVKVIDPLVDPVAHGGQAADALELVIPSLPGYGWSGKADRDRLER